MKIALYLCMSVFCCNLYADEAVRAGVKSEKELKKQSNQNNCKVIIAALRSKRNFDFHESSLSDVVLYMQQVIKETIYAKMEASSEKIDPRFRVYLASSSHGLNLQLKEAEIGTVLSNLCEKFSLVAVVSNHKITILDDKIHLDQKMYDWIYPRVVASKVDLDPTVGAKSK